MIEIVKQILEIEDKINALWIEHDNPTCDWDEISIADTQTATYRNICFLKGKQKELLRALCELQAL